MLALLSWKEKASLRSVNGCRCCVVHCVFALLFFKGVLICLYFFVSKALREETPQSLLPYALNAASLFLGLAEFGERGWLEGLGEGERGRR